HPAGWHSRDVQHVRRRRHSPHGGLCAEHHAVYFGLDHHPDPYHGVAATRGPAEGRRGGPQDPEPIHTVPHRGARLVPVLWHSGRFGGRRQRRHSSRPVFPAFHYNHADWRHH